MFDAAKLSRVIFNDRNKLSRVVKLYTQNIQDIWVSAVFMEDLKNSAAIEEAKRFSTVKKSKPY